MVQFKYEYDFCPVNYVDISQRSWLGLFSMFRKNIMLASGGIDDQPAKYVDIMQFLDALWSQHEREQMEQATQSRSSNIPPSKPKGRLR